MNEKELYKIWKKYIDRPIYRVVPERTLNYILKKGMDPSKNPYIKIIPQINKIYSLIKNLRKKGIIIWFNRGQKRVTADFVCEECLNDLNKGYLDFCSSHEQIDYYLNAIPGGGIPNSVKRLTKRLLELELPIARQDVKLITKMNNWAESLISKNSAIHINGTSKIFENAVFQLTGTVKWKKRANFIESPYLPSPFGSFEHFKKVIAKQGFRKYAYRLKHDKFYLRVRDKIPASEIKILKV